MPKLEKDVMKEARIALDNLERCGAILFYERLNSGKIRTEYGSWIQMCRPNTPDWIVIMMSKYGLVVYFPECKGGNGRQSEGQKQFQKNVEGWSIYELVTDVQQIKTTVENVTGFYANKLKSIDL